MTQKIGIGPTTRAEIQFGMHCLLCPLNVDDFASTLTKYDLIPLTGEWKKLFRLEEVIPDKWNTYGWMEG